MSEKLDPIAEATKTALAAVILGAIDGPRRDAMVQEAVTNYLDDWKLRHGVEELVGRKAAAIAKAEIESGKYDEQITAAIKAGIAQLVGQLQEAAYQAMLDTIAGKNGGTYDTKASALLPYLRIRK